ncbi:MAG: hypothetical protein WCR78_06445 [Arcobacteraceae bacterium]
MKYLLILLIMTFSVGCGSKVKILELEPNTKLSSNSILILTPDSFPKYPWEAWFVFSDKYIQLFRHLPNMMSEDVKITVRVPPENQNIDFLLDKKKSDDLERTRALPPSEWEEKNLAERGVSYNKHYVDYIGNLKCTTNVESSNIAMGVGNKKYYTVCGYYDITGAKKRIDIFYRYTYTNRGIKYDGDKTSSNVSPQIMQEQFKQDIKEIFDSLIIHDMDRERMKKEDLLYDKKYDISAEEKVKNNTGL